MPRRVVSARNEREKKHGMSIMQALSLVYKPSHRRFSVVSKLLIGKGAVGHKRGQQIR